MQLEYDCLTLNQESKDVIEMSWMRGQDEASGPDDVNWLTKAMVYYDQFHAVELIALQPLYLDHENLLICHFTCVLK